jgi:peroxisomal 2,4-dienoyl-CoA reductase
VEGDVRKKEDPSCTVEMTVKELGRLDILVNGAASNFLVEAEDLPPNGFKIGKLLWLAFS